MKRPSSRDGAHDETSNRRDTEDTAHEVFQRAHGYVPDFAEPRSFSEKLSHRVAYEVDLLYRLYASKYLAPYYAASKAGPELEFADRYGVYPELTTADLEDLPRSFVLKGSHASGVVEVVHDRDQADLDEIVERLNGSVRRVRNAQGDPDPAAVIVAEQLLVEAGQSSPSDYKFHCFAQPGRTEFRWVLQVDVDRFGAHVQNIYSDDLQVLPFAWGSRRGDGRPFVAPPNFDRMVRIAERLSADFDCIRIDLYNIDGRVIFGEITPFHQGGKGRITPREWDFKLGELWTFEPRSSPRFSRQPSGGGLAGSR